jgi:fatty acid desaturase
MRNSNKIISLCVYLLWTTFFVQTFLTNHRTSAFTPGLTGIAPKLSTTTTSSSPAKRTPLFAATLSDAAEWHRHRRKAMLQKYGDQILPLERSASSQNVGVPLLLMTNMSLLLLSLWSGRASLSLPAVIALSIFPGSILSLWQLQILHDCLHGSLFQKGASRIMGMQRKALQDQVLFWGSMPSVFGYFLYLKFGHLSHHVNVGDKSQVSLAKLFDSDQTDFEDGDVLFVAHRMKLLGDTGPTFQLPFNKSLTMSISKSGFNSWKPGKVIWNTCMFACSFMYERFMLVVNDCFVAITGRNAFFPNKPEAFHKACAKYARCATAVRLALLWFGGWKSLLFLYLSETLWSIPPHPAAAMFVTNHPSSMDDSTNTCTPSMSTYAGAWYSIFTLGTNYHCEHHDFPTIPLDKLAKLRQIAPEFYRSGSNDNLLAIFKKTFSKPDFYACMNSNIGLERETVANNEE